MLTTNSMLFIIYIISFHYILLPHNANKDCSCSSTLSLHIGNENNSTLIDKSKKKNYAYAFALNLACNNHIIAPVLRRLLQFLFLKFLYSHDLITIPS